MNYLVGRTIKHVRLMTEEEHKYEGWAPPQEGRESPGVALVLDNGLILYASTDADGRAPGTLFGRDALGNKYDFTEPFRR